MLSFERWEDQQDSQLFVVELIWFDLFQVFHCETLQKNQLISHGLPDLITVINVKYRIHFMALIGLKKNKHNIGWNCSLDIWHSLVEYLQRAYLFPWKSNDHLEIPKYEPGNRADRYPIIFISYIRLDIIFITSSSS